MYAMSPSYMCVVPRWWYPAGTITLNPRWIHVMAWRCFHVDIRFYLKIESRHVFHVDSTSCFHVDSTSCFPRWCHVMFSTLIPRVLNVESTCFQRWINARFSTLNQRSDLTWFPRWYLVLYESWFHVMFSTLNPRNVLNVESRSYFQHWINVMISTLNPCIFNRILMLNPCQY